MSLTGGQEYGQDDGVLQDRMEQTMGSAMAPMAWWIDRVLTPIRADIRNRDPHTQVYSDEAVQGLSSIYARSCHTRASIIAGYALDVGELHQVQGFLTPGLHVDVRALDMVALSRGLRPARERQARQNRVGACTAARLELANARQLATRYDYWLERPFSTDLSELEAWFWTAGKILVGRGL